MPLPIVDIDGRVAINPVAMELKTMIEAASQELFDLGAWREDFGTVDIRIFKKGMSTPKTKPVGMRTKLSIDQNAPSGVIRREEGVDVLIEVSMNLFVDELGAELLKRGATKKEVIFHFLAHETHHIDEIERQSACGILYENRQSSFAGAARPDFPSDWTLAVQELTKQYSTDRALPGSLRSAADIANEASADLVGLFWMKQQNMN